MSKKWNIRLARVYAPPSEDDHYRLLVERLWPRGLTKEKAAVDEWLKDIAPSPELRKWYGHDPEKWEEFYRRYWAELDQNSPAIDRLKALLDAGPVTFVYAARDEEHNSAVVLQEYLKRQM